MELVKTKAFPLQALGRPLGFQEVEAPRISGKSALEGGRTVSPRHRPSLPLGKISGTHFCQRLSRFQGHSAARRIVTEKFQRPHSGIEPATFRLVAQCLNQLRHRVPPMEVVREVANIGPRRLLKKRSRVFGKG
jgi:hypothetical protein